MAIVGAGCNSLQVDAQCKSTGLVWGLAAEWRWVCIHHMNWMNSCNHSNTNN